MKKTLFHSLTFPPDTISTGMIVSEIAEGINTKLHNVEVLASSPQYNVKSVALFDNCLLYTSPSPRDMRRSRMPSSA